MLVRDDRTLQCASAVSTVTVQGNLLSGGDKQVKALLCSLHCCLLLSGSEDLIPTPLNIAIQPNIQLSTHDKYLKSRPRVVARLYQ